MEMSSNIGCTIRNRKDPYQFQCLFSTDPGDKREFSVYFHSSDGKQELMASCTYNKGYECIFTQEGLSITEDYITVSETFSKQNGNFVCRNGGRPLDKFSCPYPDNSVKLEANNGTTENALKPQFHDRSDGSENGGPTIGIIICLVLGAVVILVIVFILLFRRHKQKKCHHCPEKASTKEKQKDGATNQEKQSFLENKENTFSNKKNSQMNESEKKTCEIELDRKYCDEGFEDKTSYELESDKEGSDGNSDENNSDAGFEGSIKTQ